MTRWIGPAELTCCLQVNQSLNWRFWGNMRWAEAGKFFIVDGPGADVYIDELVDFNGIDDTHDDQVDWTSGAYMRLAGETKPNLDAMRQYDMG